jgi:hypothetical protein
VRLMGLIFPISRPQTAALGGHDYAAMLEGDHDATYLSSVMHRDTAAGSDCSDHSGGSHDMSGPACCSMGACHAFEVTVAPDVHSPVTSAVPLAIIGDGQVDGIVPGRLDRPPRTV